MFADADAELARSPGRGDGVACPGAENEAQRPRAALGREVDDDPVGFGEVEEGQIRKHGFGRGLARLGGQGPGKSQHEEQAAHRPILSPAMAPPGRKIGCPLLG